MSRSFVQNCNNNCQSYESQIFLGVCSICILCRNSNQPLTKELNYLLATKIVNFEKIKMLRDMIELVTTFMIIALAELGDKTQLIALSLAAKYNYKNVLLGISSASFILMLIAVLFGKFLSNICGIQVLSALLFILFGVIMLLHKESEEEGNIDKFLKKKINPVIIAFLIFFAAEFGDKTQIATFSLATQLNSFFQVWLGSSLAMISVSSVAIFFGDKLRKIVGDKIKIVSGIIFIAVGIVMLARYFLASYCSIL